jgi:hypothetical protein
MRRGYYGLRTEIPARHPKNLFSVRDAEIRRILPFVNRGNPIRHPPARTILKQDCRRFKGSEVGGGLLRGL